MINIAPNYNLRRVLMEDVITQYPTGKTFRRILMALYHASLGKRVFYCTKKHGNCQRYREQILDMAGAFLKVDNFEFKASSLELTFPGGGSIKVLYVDGDHTPEVMRGVTGVYIEDD